MLYGRRRRRSTRRISFWATRKVTKPLEVNFKTSTGKRVSFWATKKIVKPIKVEFYVRRKRRRRV